MHLIHEAELHMKHVVNTIQNCVQELKNIKHTLKVNNDCVCRFPSQKYWHMREQWHEKASYMRKINSSLLADVNKTWCNRVCLHHKVITEFFFQCWTNKIELNWMELKHCFHIWSENGNLLLEYFMIENYDKLVKIVFIYFYFLYYMLVHGLIYVTPRCLALMKVKMEANLWGNLPQQLLELVFARLPLNFMFPTPTSLQVVEIHHGFSPISTSFGNHKIK